MAAVLDLKLVEVEALREFIQVGRTRISHIEPVEFRQSFLDCVHKVPHNLLPECYLMLSTLAGACRRTRDPSEYSGSPKS